MHSFERLDKIMETLYKTGQIRIREEARLLGVSGATFHRDLDRLEKQGLIVKVRGGAVLRQSVQTNSHFDLRLNVNVKEKKAIGILAAQEVKDDTAIFLDHSTSSLFLARELKNFNFRNLVVVTNSLAVPEELSNHQGIQTILTGGVVQNEFKALSGKWVIETFKQINIHQIFASIGAICPDLGLMTQMHFIQEILEEILLSGYKVNILADHTKFHKIATFRVASIEKAHRIFTDISPPKVHLEKIQQKGPRIIFDNSVPSRPSSTA